MIDPFFFPDPPGIGGLTVPAGATGEACRLVPPGLEKTLWHKILGVFDVAALYQGQKFLGKRFFL